MRSALALLISLILLTALQAVAEEDEALPGEFEGCSPPESPAIPDGEKATDAEMKQTFSTVKAYLKQGQEYLDCLTEVENSWGDDAMKDPRFKERLRHDSAMVDAMQAAAGRFNVELEKYRAREK
jgi:hypothetical protein